MLDPLCEYCENRENPVPPKNAVRVSNNAANDIHREVHLHQQCASAWSQRFKVSPPNGAVREAEETALGDSSAIKSSTLKAS